MAVIGDDLFGQPELEHVGKEGGDAVDVLAQQEDVVDPRRMHTAKTVGARWGVDERQPVADLSLSEL